MKDEFPRTFGQIRERAIQFLIDLDGPYTVEIHLLGTILCFWLEQRGRRVLHASAVAFGGGALGFIAGGKSGKSSIAAAFMERGFPLLTDDFLALEGESSPLIGYPGYPQMRMWPDQAQHFMGSELGLPLVHPLPALRGIVSLRLNFYPAGHEKRRQKTNAELPHEA